MGEKYDCRFTSRSVVHRHEESGACRPPPHDLFLSAAATRQTCRSPPQEDPSSATTTPILRRHETSRGTSSCRLSPQDRSSVAAGGAGCLTPQDGSSFNISYAVLRHNTCTSTMTQRLLWVNVLLGESEACGKRRGLTMKLIIMKKKNNNNFSLFCAWRENV